MSFGDRFGLSPLDPSALSVAHYRSAQWLYHEMASWTLGKVGATHRSGAPDWAEKYPAG